MGRKRKDASLGLPNRVYAKHGAFYYVHPNRRWERLGTDLAEVKRKAAILNDSDGNYGTMAHFLDTFVIACKKRVSAGSLALRTQEDYERDVVPLKAFFGHLTPAAVEPSHVGRYLDLGAEHGRPVRANREKACLSACFTWLIRNGEAGLVSNPCQGVRRNKEKKRSRYIEDFEHRAVMAQIRSPMVRAIAGLIYRTLQRPGDIQRWTERNIVDRVVAGKRERVIKFTQSKTGAELEILISPEIEECLALARSAGKKIAGITLLHRGDGKPYAEKSLSTMFRAARTRAGVADFALYDLKGKGATDMWLAGVPLERIQVLCGHDSVTTTEIYVKSHWRGVVEPNRVEQKAS
jgi:integrase